MFVNLMAVETKDYVKQERKLLKIKNMFKISDLGVL